MTTHSVTCAICDQRIAIAARHVPAQPACSADCKEALNRRRARRRELAAWWQGSAPIGPQPHHRVRAALAETRAAVASLLSEGRRARLTFHSGDYQ